MKVTGIVRKVDQLGRVCLPKELRCVYDMMDGDTVEFVGTDDGILIRPYNPNCVLCKGKGAKPHKFGDNEALVCDTCMAQIKQLGGAK